MAKEGWAVVSHRGDCDSSNGLAPSLEVTVPFGYPPYLWLRDASLCFARDAKRNAGSSPVPSRYARGMNDPVKSSQVQSSPVSLCSRGERLDGRLDERCGANC